MLNCLQTTLAAFLRCHRGDVTVWPGALQTKTSRPPEQGDSLWLRRWVCSEPAPSTPMSPSCTPTPPFHYHAPSCTRLFQTLLLPPQGSLRCPAVPHWSTPSTSPPLRTPLSPCHGVLPDHFSSMSSMPDRARPYPGGQEGGGGLRPNRLWCLGTGVSPRGCHHCP